MARKVEGKGIQGFLERGCLVLPVPGTTAGPMNHDEGGERVIKCLTAGLKAYPKFL